MGSGSFACQSIYAPSHEKEHIIPLFEDKETAKELIEALEAKYTHTIIIRKV